MSITDATPTTTTTDATRYLRPGWATRHLMNRSIARLVRFGVGPWGARELRVVGRRSGEVRTTVVNVLTLEGVDHLVAPRGETEWVRNIRAADGRAELRLGRRREAVRAVEVGDEDKVPVLRAYLERWAFEVGQFFEGISASSTDDELRAIAPGFPVFALERQDNR